MKIKLLTVLLITSLFLHGCFNYVDINQAIFVTSMIIDITEEGNPIMMVETFHSYRSNETNDERGNRIFYDAVGETLFDAVRKFNTFSSYKMNYTQNKAIIFTEKAASHGLKQFIDFLDRDQELLIRPYIFIYLGDQPKDLIRANMKENDYLGLYLFEMQEGPAVTARRATVRFNSYLNDRLKGRNVTVIPTLTYEEVMGEEKVKIAGGGIMVEDKLVTLLDEEQMRWHHLLMGTAEGGLIITAHPDFPEKNVVLEVLNSSTKTSISMENNNVILKKSIDIRSTFAETQESITLDPDTLKKIQQTAIVDIEGKLKELFNLYQEKGIDIFDLEDVFKMKYPRVNITNVIEVAELEVDINIDIIGGSDHTSFR